MEYKFPKSLDFDDGKSEQKILSLFWTNVLWSFLSVIEMPFVIGAQYHVLWLQNCPQLVSEKRLS